MNNQSVAKEMEMNIKISFYNRNHCYRLTLELRQNINQLFKKIGGSGLDQRPK